MHQHVAVVVFFALTFASVNLARADAMDSFRYVQGEVSWIHTKAPFESEGSKGFTGLSVDTRTLLMIFTLRVQSLSIICAVNNNQMFYGLSLGGVVNIHSPLNAYGQIGLFGFSRNREVQADIDSEGSSTVQHLDDCLTP